MKQVDLGAFDPGLVARERITADDLERVHRYVEMLQGHISPNTWDDIAFGGYYGTSALLHEVVQLRLLLARDPALLNRSAAELYDLVNHPENLDAHVRALEAEYRYLYDTIRQVLGIEVNVAALVRANASRPFDWDALFESNLPFFQ